MDSLGPGEAGVLDWCNSIRLQIAKDPGREFLHTQIQTQGFDFLDSYLENVFSREEEEPVYQLLKTPGKKKDAAKRTRAATAASAKLKAINSMMLNELDMAAHTRTASGSSSSSQASTSSKVQPPATKKKAQKVVTIVDTPEPPKMDIVDEDMALPAPTIPAPQFIPLDPPPAPTAVPQSQRSPSPALQPTPQDVQPLAEQVPPAPEPGSAGVQSDVHAPSSADVELESQEAIAEVIAPQHLPVTELSIIAEADEPSDQSRLSPVRPTEQPQEYKMEEDHEEDHEVPIRDVLHDPMDQDLTVPLRDEPDHATRKRKPSVSTFSGISAPSPARKSMRMSHEPTGNAAFPPLAHTPGAGLGGAGKRTSWLTQAKQVKALELGSGKRVAGATANATAASEDKAKGGAAADSKDDAEPQSEALAFLRGKRKATSLEDNTTRTMPLPKAQSQPPVTPAPAFDFADDVTVPLNDLDGEEHTLYRLKMTVEGARAKSMGKSLGGNAAAELAEARAKAEAKIAQRSKGEGKDAKDGEQTDEAPPPVVAPKESLSPPTEAATKPPTEAPQTAAEATQPAQMKSTPTVEDKAESVLADDPSRRMSVSDLMSDAERSRVRTSTTDKAANLSTSTTPPHSPPVVLSKGKAAAFAPPPVFSKPPTVFAAPPRQPKEGLPPSTSKEPVFKLPVANPFSLPATTLGVPATLQTQKSAPALSAQSSKASALSDSIFDKEEPAPAWMTGTQDTEHSPAPSKTPADGDEDMDEDDSWHVDEKFQANQLWTPFGFGGGADKDDTMTWSTLPSRSTSQRGGDTGPVPGESESLAAEAHRAANEMLEREKERMQGSEPTEADGDGQVEVDSEADRAQEINEEDLQMDDMDIDDDDYRPGVDTELEDLVAAGKSTISLVKQPPRAPSQQSMASTSSSQSQLGFFGQASRLVNSVLGSSKTKKAEPVKSIARAAAVAKKQQEEAEKKAARMKEMENRRQQAQQRKADEEKARTQEEERKAKEEADRRKREREEHTDKRPLKPIKKAEDDTTKRKLNTEAEKKIPSAKPPSKDSQTSRTVKPPSANAPSTATKIGVPLKSTLSKQASTASLTAASSSSAIPKAPASESKTSKIATSSSNPKLASAKGKTKAQPQPDKEDELPSKVLQTQMANRAKAQMQAVQTPRQAPPVTSESIELPDINSEYSDSEDEGRPRTFDPPEWAQSPELRQQLESQSRMNPDEIFGPVAPLRMEDMFRTRQSRFRARTSSANWAGPDGLTQDEEREYARRMGFR